uniref:Uncharacterized protein n=1 Tax=Tanacetum cinerariifolium TaxID=118510 RepID=A0A6L2L4Q0_TANCI|nr:hypothetical protein [Tanacetum cinerariifolium]GEX15553.1 hypothetical protein [Tanacetum cinerariifolium]
MKQAELKHIDGDTNEPRPAEVWCLMEQQVWHVLWMCYLLKRWHWFGRGDAKVNFNTASRFGVNIAELIIVTIKPVLVSQVENPPLSLELDEETAPEGQQQHVILVEDTAEDEPFDLGYRATRRRALERTRYIVPSTYEVGQGFGSTPNQQLETTGETPTQTHTRLPIHTTWEDLEDSTIYRNIECDIPLVRLPVRALPAPLP